MHTRDRQAARELGLTPQGLTSAAYSGSAVPPVGPYASNYFAGKFLACIAVGVWMLPSAGFGTDFRPRGSDGSRRLDPQVVADRVGWSLGQITQRLSLAACYALSAVL